jgi:hypothetical protein
MMTILMMVQWTTHTDEPKVGYTSYQFVVSGNNTNYSPYMHRLVHE